MHAQRTSALLNVPVVGREVDEEREGPADLPPASANAEARAVVQVPPIRAARLVPEQLDLGALEQRTASARCQCSPQPLDDR